MFSIVTWQNDVWDPARTYRFTNNPDGTVSVQQAGTHMQTGTPQSADNFNRIEQGILDTQIATGLLNQMMMHKNTENDKRLTDLENEVKAEVGTVTLTNSHSYPFNNSQVTIALLTTRKTTNYIVEFEIQSYSGGLPGDIIVSGKAVNGFKMEFDGSASSVTVKYFVKGGFQS